VPPHHVNETVARGKRRYWDVALLAWGAAAPVDGWVLHGGRDSRSAEPWSQPD
jgi:hypothetical protein